MWRYSFPNSLDKLTDTNLLKAVSRRQRVKKKEYRGQIRKVWWASVLTAFTSIAVAEPSLQETVLGSWTERGGIRRVELGSLSDLPGE
jgi:hypothetical protein